MSTELVTQREPSVMDILSSAVLNGNVSVDVIERLTKLQREQVEYQAMVEFNEAMHRCQLKMQPIRAEADSDKGKYANYAQIDRVMRPIYTGEGISLSFSDAEPIGEGWLRLICYVSRGGYTREYRKDMPLVTTGAKGNAVMTPIHAQGSADQYARRCLISDIFNIAIDKSKDDDGNGGMKVSEAIAKTVSELLHCSDMATLKEQYRMEYKAAVEANDSTAVKLFMDAYTKRKAELS